MKRRAATGRRASTLVRYGSGSQSVSYFGRAAAAVVSQAKVTVRRALPGGLMHRLLVSLVALPIVALVGLFAVPLSAVAQDLTLKRVMLSSGGLGYFEYEA